MSDLSGAFRDELLRRAGHLVKSLTRHRERYIRAWTAVYGLHPADCELVEERHPMTGDGIIRTIVYARKRSRP